MGKYRATGFLKGTLTISSCWVDAPNSGEAKLIAVKFCGLRNVTVQAIPSTEQTSDAPEAYKARSIFDVK
jgi:hypothetical protein